VRHFGPGINGHFIINAVCPKCGGKSFIFIHSVNTEAFSEFYDKAVEELKK
jgi:predicted  nucleic acid-binding Zn-ribbon protein